MEDLFTTGKLIILEKIEPANGKDSSDLEATINLILTKMLLGLRLKIEIDMRSNVATF